MLIKLDEELYVNPNEIAFIIKEMDSTRIVFKNKEIIMAKIDINEIIKKVPF